MTEVLDRTPVDKITMDNVIDLLEKAVARKGRDYVYHIEHKTCVYAKGVGKNIRPVCLIGQVEDITGADLIKARRATDAFDLFGYQIGDIDDPRYENLVSEDGTFKTDVFLTLAEDEEIFYKKPLDPDMIYGYSTVPATRGAVLVLKAAQLVQDHTPLIWEGCKGVVDKTGPTWGQALDAAKAVHARLKGEGIE